MTRRSILAPALALLGACGADFGGEDPPSCDLAVAGPGDAVVGDSVVLEALFSGDATGLQSATWAVDRGGAPVAHQAEDADGLRISFAPVESGPHRATLTGSVGSTECVPSVRTINVLPPDASLVAHRLRVVPPASAGAPAQSVEVRLPSEGDYDLGAIGLAASVPVEGSVTVAGAPVPAYLRASWSADTAEIVEGFADEDGFSLPLRPGVHHLLVVPEDPELAPLALSGDAGALGGEHDLAGALALGGVVEDAGGAPIAGAAVTLVVDGVPSSLGLTGADGRYQVGARPGAEVSLRVAPPPGSSLPALEGSAQVATIGDGSGADVSYAAATPVAVDARVERDGAPVPGARTVWIAAPIEGAGTSRLDGGAPTGMRGQVRRLARAGGDGRVALDLWPGSYQVVVEDPADGRVGVLAADLAVGAPATLAVPAPVAVSGRLVDAAGVPLAAARVRARPRGVLASVGAGGASSETDDAGGFVLLLAAGSAYDLVFDPAGADAGRRHLAIEPGPAALGDVVAPRAAVAQGRLELGGGAPLVGARLTLRCAACADPDAPVAEAVTDATGRFVLRVPEPALP